MGPHHLPEIIVGEDCHGACQLSLNLRWKWIYTSPKNQIREPVGVGKLAMAPEPLSNGILNLKNNKVLDVKLSLRNKMSYQALLI